jgi:Zn-dependent protease
MGNEAAAIAFISYIVFLFSTVCHEAAHAVVGMLLGDKTAYWNGQVTLNPIPHIRQEPFGLGLLPLLSMFSAMQTGGYGVFGFASAPYDPLWAQRWPKRAAIMALAGPAANLTLAGIAGVLMKVLLISGLLSPHASGEFGEAAFVVLNVMFFENLLLCVWNMLPIPPLDGFSALLLIVPENKASVMFEVRNRVGMFFPIVMLLISTMFWEFFSPFYDVVSRGVFGF